MTERQTLQILKCLKAVEFGRKQGVGLKAGRVITLEVPFYHWKLCGTDKVGPSLIFIFE